jgi:hypothetical protein
LHDIGPNHTGAGNRGNRYFFCLLSTDAGASTIPSAALPFLGNNFGGLYAWRPFVA